MSTISKPPTLLMPSNPLVTFVQCYVPLLPAQSPTTAVSNSTFNALILAAFFAMWIKVGVELVRRNKNVLVPPMPGSLISIIDHNGNRAFGPLELACNNCGRGRLTIRDPSAPEHAEPAEAARELVEFVLVLATSGIPILLVGCKSCGASIIILFSGSLVAL